MRAPRSGRALHAALAVAAALLSPAAARGDCPQLAAPTGYVVGSCSGPTGTVCSSVACAPGYQGTPTSSVCQVNGTWTPLTGCSLVSCGTPAAKVGYAIDCSATFYGSICTVACATATGYVGTPTASYTTCLASGQWSPSSASLAGCALATCPTPAEPTGYTLTCGGTSFGDACDVACATGYAGVPVIASVTCTTDGWSTDPSLNSGCAPVDCGAPAPRTGYALSCAGGTTYGAACAIGCAGASGWVGTPSATSTTCLASAEWSVPSASLSGCALATCATPAAPAGYTPTCGGTSFGDTCGVTCATGYVGSPATTALTCGLSGWSPDPTVNSGCAPVDCGAPAPRTGYAPSCPGTTTYGASCTIACATASGWVGTPSATSTTCLATGQWSPSSASLSGCALSTCPAPATPAGYTAACGGTSFGDACTLSCATGHVGSPATTAVTCGLSGWSPDPAVNSGCTPAACGTPSIPGADVSGCAAHAHYGDAPCTPPCTEGHSGSPTATCSAAGTWTIGGGCSAIPCWPSPGTNGDSCGTAGQVCLSGSCAAPSAGQLCASPYALAPGVERVFSLDGQHDLLAATTCPGALDAGKDVFVEFAATAVRPYRLDASVDGAAGLDALALGSCASTACATLDAQGTATTRVATVEPASAGTIVLAVHVRGASAGATARVTVTPVPDPPPAPPPPASPSGGSGCGCGTVAGPAAAAWAALALAVGPSARRRRRDP